MLLYIIEVRRFLYIKSLKQNSMLFRPLRHFREARAVGRRHIPLLLPLQPLGCKKNIPPYLALAAPLLIAVLVDLLKLAAEPA